VRVTIETNLVTSEGFSVFDVIICPSPHARSATVSIVTLLMVGLHPVSGSAHYLRLPVETDRLNTGLELVCVPVCIQFYFYKFL
jgi:hypothetical protein